MLKTINQWTKLPRHSHRIASRSRGTDWSHTIVTTHRTSIWARLWLTIPLTLKLISKKIPDLLTNEAVQLLKIAQPPSNLVESARKRANKEPETLAIRTSDRSSQSLQSTTTSQKTNLRLSQSVTIVAENSQMPKTMASVATIHLCTTFSSRT